MRIIFISTILIIFSNTLYADSLLENSIWGRAAKYAGIKVETFYGIAAQETGMRWSDGTFRPWPWTLNINVSEKGIKAGPRRYASKEQAEKALKNLVEKNIKNVDIGIMQINLYWHGKAVINPVQLLDPVTNITVAAKYLRLLNKNKPVSDVVGFYHAPNDTSRRVSYIKSVSKYERIIHGTNK